ncbi:MAG: mismatch repair protein MutS [Planctomycetota bacterium]
MPSSSEVRRSSQSSAEDAAAMAPSVRYQQRLEQILAETVLCERRDRRFVKIRTLLGLLQLGVIVLCVGESERVSWLWLLLPLAAFLAVLPFDRRCLRELQRLQAARRFLESRLSRLQRIFGADLPDGREYSSDQHPWTQDLDVFGQGSLFQMLNECRTQPGRRQLAEWMMTVPTADEIRVRQSRARGLKDSLALRESLACIPDNADWTAAEQLLQTWVREPARPISTLVLIWSLLLGAAALPMLILVATDVLSLRWLLGLVILQAPAVAMTRQQISQTALVMDNVDAALRQFGAVIEAFEQHPVEEPSVRDLLNRFTSELMPTSQAIAQLSRLTQWLNNAMRNQFFAPIAWACGLFVLLTHRMESWRRRHGPDVPDWLRTAAVLEATLSVAGYNFDHPSDCVPEILDERRELIAQDLGHPLLNDAICVRNSVQLGGEQPLMLISGSNMSGKSTFLRSIGASVVLTYCGAVVRAACFQTFAFQLGTAMRVSDSLQEGRSLFYSVLQRLKAVVDLTNGPRTVLFLLDEILHGTNSHDRRRGAEAVIRSLVDRGAVGIVTTHDLALTRIADSMPGQAVNKHFEDTIVDGTMLFDYRLRDGVVERSNAIELMRMLGLDV